jgi:transposase
MKRIYRRCCGIDVHKATLTVCVRLHGAGAKLSQDIRRFGTTSDELLRLYDWLSAQRVSHVAMEATGVYWKPVFYVLEQGFTLLLVNPADVKRMPGRKTDVSDCAWLAQLLENGLLRPSFIPPRAIRELRDLVRYRSELKHDHTRVANRLHKVLQDADLKLSSVMSDILGVSGRQILRQLATGHSDPAALAELARGSLRAKRPALRQALTGRFSEHHAFLISQALTELDNLEESMTALAVRIEQHLVPFAQELELLSTIPGVKRLAATAILSEIGMNMSCFPSTAHLDSWAGMAPGNHESAGKRRRAKARKGNRWLRTILVECGQAAGKSRNTALAAIYRRMVIRAGRKHAAFVVGRHILNIAYHLLAERTTYRELGPSYFEQRRAEQLKRRCLDQLRTLAGY